MAERVAGRKLKVFDLKWKSLSTFGFFFYTIVMLSWSLRRQLLIAGIAILFVLFVIALPTFFVVYRAPSCSDGKQNQKEAGVDCGGPCSLLCKAAALQPIVHWQRVFPATGGVWNALAYVENPNLASGVRRIGYLFKLYDAGNILIAERRGETDIPPRKVFGIFEGGISVGERTPTRVAFEFTEAPPWDKTVSPNPELRISDHALSRLDTSPRLDATLSNANLFSVLNIEVVAVVYDGEGNAIAASRTQVGKLAPKTSVPLVFTWPSPFPGRPSRVETVYRVLSF